MGDMLIDDDDSDDSIYTNEAPTVQAFAAAGRRPIFVPCAVCGLKMHDRTEINCARKAHDDYRAWAHSACFKCLELWMDKSQNCPACSRKFTMYREGEGIKEAKEYMVEEDDDAAEPGESELEALRVQCRLEHFIRRKRLNEREAAAVRAFEAQLQSFVGQEKLKADLRQLQSAVLRESKRAAPGAQRVAHMALLGEKGLGKTSVANVIFQLLKGLGLVEDKFERVLGSQLSDKGKVETTLKALAGGVLFVDEAHSLVNSAAANRCLTGFCDPGGFRCIGARAAGGGTSSSGEGSSINTLIIAAGPKAQMEKWLLPTNPKGDPGLGDRLSKRYVMERYNENELVKIAESMLRNSDGQHRTSLADPAAREALRLVCREIYEQPDSSNARDVEFLLQDVKAACDHRWEKGDGLSADCPYTASDVKAGAMAWRERRGGSGAGSSSSGSGSSGCGSSGGSSGSGSSGGSSGSGAASSSGGGGGGARQVTPVLQLDDPATVARARATLLSWWRQRHEPDPTKFVVIKEAMQTFREAHTEEAKALGVTNDIRTAPFIEELKKVLCDDPEANDRDEPDNSGTFELTTADHGYVDLDEGRRKRVGASFVGWAVVRVGN